MPEDTYVRVRAAGPYACFSRPEMKVERVSYEVMTPSAARGVLEAIMWKPEIRWVIRRIELLRPIRYIGFRRNEIQSKVAPRTVQKWMRDPRHYEPQATGAGSDDATPRNTLALRDLAYVIEAEPRVYAASPENPPRKYVEMFLRRVDKGQCFHRPYLGCREFACEFSAPDPNERPIEVTLDVGLMLYDIVFDRIKGENRPIFFRARIENGILDARPEVVLRDANQRQEVLTCSCRR